MASQPTVETLLATANAYIQIFTTLDPADLLAIAAENYSHTMAPASLGFSKDGPMDRAHFAAHLGGLRGLLRSFPVRAKETWPNPSLRQVVVWADSRTEFHEHVKDVQQQNGKGEDEWDFRGEYVFVLFMDQSGRQVERVVEFLDSKASEDIKGLISRALRRKGEVKRKRPGDVLGLSET